MLSITLVTFQTVKNLDDKDEFLINFDSYVSQHLSDDFKRKIEICESCKEQSNPNKNIKELYIYDFLFGNTETEYKFDNETQDTVETNLRRKNLEANGFENIFNYLEKISSNFVYLGAFLDETTYVSLSNTRIASIDYKEKVLVFDMDNTLFPTKFIKKELEKNGLSQTQDDIGKLREDFLYQKFRGKYRLPKSRCKDIVQRTFKKKL
ncbi:hypothetical protein CWI38_2455p0010 [Hamiltosporidium tvaerminnensis]|uniref:Uncharacterized protein n=1 Tax=Hamiltosporidium tvaerminnensis TaxID=1176355 RepID=A0A4Q9LG96_9MICR|nr:hypothetical protein CWI38_2455p0010 [Hamiltosporidium tvaerminnensis]